MFSTSDINLAAALMACGHRLERIAGEDWKKSFMFPVSDEIERDRMDFLHDDLMVRAKSMAQHLKDLKSNVK